MARWIWPLLLALLVAPVSFPQGATAQNRLGIDVAVGSQTYLNQFFPHHPGTAGAFAAGGSWQLAEPHDLWLRYAVAAYEVRSRDGSTKEHAVASFLAGYRYTFRNQETLRPYVGIGFGASDPIAGFDEGNKAASTVALGLRWLNWRDGALGLYLEYRMVGWEQDNMADSTEQAFGVEGQDIGVQSAEFTFGVAGVIW